MVIVVGQYRKNSKTAAKIVGSIVVVVSLLAHHHQHHYKHYLVMWLALLAPHHALVIGRSAQHASRRTGQLVVYAQKRSVACDLPIRDHTYYVHPHLLCKQYSVQA